MPGEQAQTKQVDRAAGRIIQIVTLPSLMIAAFAVLSPLGAMGSLGGSVQHLLRTLDAPRGVRVLLFDIADNAWIVLIGVIAALLFVGACRGARRGRRQVHAAMGRPTSESDAALEARAEAVGITVTEVHRTAGGQFVLRDLVRVLEKHDRAARREESLQRLRAAKSDDEEHGTDAGAAEPRTVGGAAAASVSAAGAAAAGVAASPDAAVTARSASAPEPDLPEPEPAPAGRPEPDQSDPAPAPPVRTEPVSEPVGSAPTGASSGLGDVYTSTSLYTSGGYSTSYGTSSAANGTDQDGQDRIGTEGRVGEDEEEQR